MFDGNMVGDRGVRPGGPWIIASDQEMGTLSFDRVVTPHAVGVLSNFLGSLQQSLRLPIAALEPFQARLDYQRVTQIDGHIGGG